MTSTPLLPLTREASTASLTLSRTSPPSRVRLGRFSPGHLSLTRRYSSPPPHSPISTDQPTSLSGRLKLLIKSYGWYALGVYAVIGIFDFGLAFGLVHLLGAEQMSKWSAQAKALITDLIHPTDPNAPASDGVETAPKGGNEGLVAMLLIAYTVHKTLFLPVRLGLTAAFTPKIVKWLASRGWSGRAGTVRAANHMRDRVRQARGKDKMED